MIRLVSHSPLRLPPRAEAPDVAPVRTALRWAAFAYLLRKDKAFAYRLARQVMDSLEDYSAVQAEALAALDEALPWLVELVEGVTAEPVTTRWGAWAEQLDLVAGEVRQACRQCFTEAGFILPWDRLDKTRQRWLRHALVSWSEALLSLETRALNRAFPDYAPFAIDLRQQLKQPGFAALYVEPDAVEEELWIAFARMPEVRHHLERRFGRGRQLRTVWALPKRREIANWLVLEAE